MKIFIKAIPTFCFILVLSTACNGSVSAPPPRQTQVMGTAISAAFTQVAQTQLAIPPTPYPSPAVTEIVLPEDAVQLVQKHININSYYGNPMYSPDGKWLYTWSRQGVYAYDTASYRNVHQVSSIAARGLSPDGKIVIREDGLLFSLESGQELPKLEVPRYWVSGPAAANLTKFSSDGSLIAQYFNVNQAGSYAWVAVWRLADGKLINTFKGEYMALSPDNRRIAVMLSVQDIPLEPSRNHIYLYDLQTGEQLGDWLGGQPAFLSDNSLVMASGGYTRILDPRTLTVRHGFEGIFAAFSPDEKLVATLAGDYVRIYRVSDGKVLRNLKAGSSIDDADLHFSADGKLLAGFVVDGQCCSGHIDYSFLWRVADGSSLVPLRACPQILPSPDGQAILVCGHILRTSDGSLIVALQPTFIGRVDDLAFTPDGRQIIVANSYSKGLYVYPVDDDGPFWTPQKADPEIYLPILKVVSPNDFSRVFTGQPTEVPSPDGKLLARMVMSDVTIFRTSGEGEPFRIPTAEVTRLAFSPDVQVLALGLMNGAVQLWDLTSRQKIYTLPTQSNGSYVGGLAFSPDGKLLAVGLENGIVRLFGISMK